MEIVYHNCEFIHVCPNLKLELLMQNGAKAQSHDPLGLEEELAYTFCFLILK